MATTRQGFFVPTGTSVDIEAKATAVAGEANITSATVDKYTKIFRIDVLANESAGAADDAETVLSDAITAVGDLMQQPGTEYVDT